MSIESSRWYAINRVGCATCDWVAVTTKHETEEHIHEMMCPKCGAMTMHHYPKFGSWPSDHDVPPCQDEALEELPF